MSFSLKAFWYNLFPTNGSYTPPANQVPPPIPNPPPPPPRPEPAQQQPTCVGKGIVESLKREPGRWKVEQRQTDCFRVCLAYLCFDSPSELTLEVGGRNSMMMGDGLLPGLSHIHTVYCRGAELNDADEILIARYLEENPPADSPLEAAINKAAALKRDLAHFTSMGCPPPPRSDGPPQDHPINLH